LTAVASSAGSWASTALLNASAASGTAASGSALTLSSAASSSDATSSSGAGSTVSGSSPSATAGSAGSAGSAASPGTFRVLEWPAPSAGRQAFGACCPWLPAEISASRRNLDAHDAHFRACAHLQRWSCAG
jgi:hypothetical protein